MVVREIGVLVLVLLLVIPFAVADSAPDVNLTSPSNASSINVGNMPLIFNFTVNDESLSNCSLWADFNGTFLVNQTIVAGSYGDYQEDANETSVGLGVKAVDGNWSSYEARNNYTFLMNYTKLNGTTSALWMISAGVLIDHDPVNYSIPSDCWNYDADKLVLMSKTNKDETGLSYWYCYNGVAWKIVRTYNGGKGFWEEGIWWGNSTIENGSVVNFESVNLGVGSYNWNVLCYDTLGQSNWSNNFSLTVYQPQQGGNGGGGSGGGDEEEEEEEEEDDEGEVIEPEEGEDTLSQEQVSEIRRSTRISYSSGISSGNLESENLSISFTNLGTKAIKNITVVIEKPPVEEKPTLLHPRRIWGWDMIDLIGWVTASYVEEPHLLEWQVSEPKEYDIIMPGEKIDIDLGIRPPLTKKKVVELHFDILSYGQSIYSESLPVRINTTEFLVVADVRSSENLVDIYMIISNLKEYADVYYVELNFNQGRLTSGAEYFGPYKIKAKDTMLFAYQYAYIDEFAAGYTLRYALFDKDGKVKESVGEVNLLK